MRTITDGVEGYTDRELRSMTCEQVYAEKHRLMFIVYKSLTHKAELYKVLNYENNMGEIAGACGKCDFCMRLDSVEGIADWRCGDERCDSCWYQDKKLKSINR